MFTCNAFQEIAVFDWQSNFYECFLVCRHDNLFDKPNIALAPLGLNQGKKNNIPLLYNESREGMKLAIGGLSLF